MSHHIEKLHDGVQLVRPKVIEQLMGVSFILWRHPHEDLGQTTQHDSTQIGIDSLELGLAMD
jgi:hypothetical protein